MSDNDDDGWENDGDDGWGEQDGDDGWGDQNDGADRVDEEDWIMENAEELKPPRELQRQFSAEVLSPDAIDEAIMEQIRIIQEETELPEEHCLLLLRKFKWNIAKIRDQYFAGDQEQILQSAGVCVNPQPPARTSGELECQVCMDDLPVTEFYCLDCGHQSTCRNCWIDYLTDAISTKSCVSLPCPSFRCDVVISKNVFRELLAAPQHQQALERYERFRRENFVEFNKDYGFCPGANCQMIYSAAAGVAQSVKCVTCGHQFCWACKQDRHHPCACHIAEQWNIKCSSEAENIQWILAKTKRCPKCGVHIEKNQGCNHMTCRKTAGGCGYEFCWLCKGDWKTHGSATGGYYQCNIYETNKKDGRISTEEKAAEDAINELQRYEFHWTRFDSHVKSSIHATKQRDETHNKMHELSSRFGWRLNESQFLLDAVEEVIQCWHVLAWTYPIAYYFDSAIYNLDLFKGHQQQLEHFCDGIQEKLDFSLETLGEIKVRQNVIAYTRTAQQFRKNLVDHIDNELAF